jgi:superfamily II DNA/RNA helicase
MVIAAKTGQGKTLTFGLPILDILIKKIDRAREQKKDTPLDDVKALIISPTRELAI